MTTIHDINGVHTLNRFIWSELLRVGYMKNEYNGLVPIIPSQQIPAFTDMAPGKPFIVYEYIVATYDTDAWANVEQTVYRIYSDNEAQLRVIKNFIIDLCKRWDWSAADLNEFVRTSGTTLDKRFDFKYVQVMGGSSPAPFESEDGRQDAHVTVRVAYTQDEISGLATQRKGMRA